MLMKPPVDLGRAQIGDVDAATVIAVENLGVLDNGLHVGGGAAAVAGGWHAAQCARLDGQGHLAGHPLLAGHGGHTVGHAEAQVYQALPPQLHGAPSGDNLADAQLHWLQGTHGHPDLAGPLRMVGDGVEVVLAAVLRPPHHHIVHEAAVDLHAAGVQGVVLHQGIHLGDDGSAVVLGSKGHL